MTKKMLTRAEFEEKRNKGATDMAADVGLNKMALELLNRADHHMWIHQNNWMGEPILNTAQDIMAMQEIIYKSRPKYIIEVGVAWGGMLLFYSSLMEVLGGEKIIAIDIYIPDDLKERINAHKQLAGRIEWINGSSTASETLAKVKEIVGDSKDNMVVLDSHHSHDHVLNELKAYEQLVGKDHYMVCGDTVIENLPEVVSRERDWGHGNSPMTALHEFLSKNDQFERDVLIENKLLLSCHPEGYLRRK